MTTPRAAAEPPGQLALLPPQAPAEIVARECPTDPGEIIAGYQRALSKAMKPRADGGRHLDTCRNARVNSQWFRCQDECTDAQVMLVWGPLWLERQQQRAAPGPSRGMGRVG